MNTALAYPSRLLLQYVTSIVFLFFHHHGGIRCCGVTLVFVYFVVHGDACHV